MNDFFANLFEWWGVNPMYSTDLADYLRGWDITCSDYSGTPWYANIGLIVVGLTILTYILFYHVIDSSKYLKAKHWWIIALLLMIISFSFSFSIPYNALRTGEYCEELYMTTVDAIGFGLSVSLWSLVFFIIITTLPYPRALSNNLRHTTFWFPN